MKLLISVNRDNLKYIKRIERKSLLSCLEVLMSLNPDDEEWGFIFDTSYVVGNIPFHYNLQHKERPTENPEYIIHNFCEKNPAATSTAVQNMITKQHNIPTQIIKKIKEEKPIKIEFNSSETHIDLMI